MSLDDLISNIKETVRQIREESPKIVVQTANDSKALIERRIVNTGSSSTGSKSNYKEGYYKNFRKDKGRQVNHKDYRFTGAMWSSIKAIPSTLREKGNNFFQVDVDSITKEGEDKIKYNNKRDGIKILSNTDSEKEQLQGFMYNKIKRIIDSNL